MQIILDSMEIIGDFKAESIIVDNKLIGISIENINPDIYDVSDDIPEEKKLILNWDASKDGNHEKLTLFPDSL